MKSTIGVWGVCAALGILAGGCAARAPMAELLNARVAAEEASAPLVEDVFDRDRMAEVTQDELLKVLGAPVFLPEHARLGIVRVAGKYEIDSGLPVERVTGALRDEIADEGYFEAVTELSGDWPCGGSVAGLRQLATRYRADFLLLYRHRFVDRDRTNAWGWTWLTLLGGLIAPVRTVEAAGVLEATLFDVRSGTLYFSAFTRVQGERDVTVWPGERATAGLKARLIDDAARELAEEVTKQLQSLLAARPEGQERIARRAPLRRRDLRYAGNQDATLRLEAPLEAAEPVAP